MGKYVLSERDYQRVQTMLRWYEREKNLRDTIRRRNINIPATATCARSVKIQENGVPDDTPPTADTYFTCKLLDKNGEVIGDAIEVYPRTHIGATPNPYNGDVWPDLNANDVLAVYKDLDGKWYFPFVFDDTTECDV